jgi:DNA repair protein RAD57
VCLQCALHVQLPLRLGGFGGGCIFLTSEGAFPNKRLLQMAQSLAARVTAQDGLELSAYDLLDNIHINSFCSVEDMEHALAYTVPAYIERLRDTPVPPEADGDGARPQRVKSSPLPIRLLVIDSVTAPLRTEFEPSSPAMFSRSKALASLADQLHRLANTYQLAVLVVNQVTEVFTRNAPPSNNASHAPLSTPPLPPNDVPMGHGYPWPSELAYDVQSRFFSGQTPNLSKAASLGLAWANCINTRVILSRTNRRRGAAQEGGAQEDIRRATLVFSPFAERASVDYVIDSEGFRSLGEKVDEPRWGAGSVWSARMASWEAKVSTDGAHDEDGSQESRAEETSSMRQLSVPKSLPEDVANYEENELADLYEDAEDFLSDVLAEEEALGIDD